MPLDNAICPQCSARYFSDLGPKDGYMCVERCPKCAKQETHRVEHRRLQVAESASARYQRLRNERLEKLNGST